MPLLDFRPHEIILDRESQLPRVLHKRDYIQLIRGQDRVYVQQGHIFLGGGDPLSPDQVPPWFWEDYGKLTPQARRSVGLELPEDRVVSVEQLPADFVHTFEELPDEIKQELLRRAGPQAPRMPVEAPEIPDTTQEPSLEKSLVLDHPEAPKPTSWTCDECGKDVPMNTKGVHIGLHRRLAKKARGV
jgi:hypothetical protein